jgi:hypothetical protein
MKLSENRKQQLIHAAHSAFMWAKGRPGLIVLVWAFLVFSAITSQAASANGETVRAFPPRLESYGDSQMPRLWDVLQNRVRQQPLNLWVSLLFLGAILHAFFTHRFLHWAHVLEERQKLKMQNADQGGAGRRHTSPGAHALHFLGEVEAIFGIWCVPLLILLAVKTGWSTAVNYFSNASYVEPVFVVVIMAIASTRPILRLAERCLGSLAKLGGGGPAAWWLAILTLGPVLGSFITEPAAMTISALLLAKQFYVLKPSARLAYATLGLLFVNVSVGGAMTHFAAPPVLMVAAPWGWTTPFMFKHFGWVALAGIVVSNALYYVTFRGEFSRLRDLPGSNRTDSTEPPIPAWVTGIHLAFMVWSVLNAHYPALLVGGLLFFLALREVTEEHQSDLQLRSPLLVGFFLAGLVIHGGLQQWWIGPVLGRLTEVPLLLGATVLTAFNDNAAITYLAALVPNLSDSLKYSVVAGALAGGGLTVIANAPNPAGQSILARFFPEGIAPLGLLAGALPATIIMILCFLFAR